MTGDIPAPALRLLEQLPSRTHERIYATEERDPYGRLISHQRKQSGVKAPVKRGAYHAARKYYRGRVQVAGKIYALRKDVLRDLHICSATFSEWIKSGKARRCK